MGKKLIGSDYLLVLLDLNGREPIKGSVRLTKMMFLFEQQIAPILKKKGLDCDKLPEFVSYNYGPFSKELYLQLELFKSIGFIEVVEASYEGELSGADNFMENEFVEEGLEGEEEYKVENKPKVYKITGVGSEYVNGEILPMLNEEQKMLLKQFKQKVVGMPITQLLYYVYTRYPEFTDKSLIKNEVLKNGK